MIRNLRLTLATIGGHATDDPIVLILQASRRMPEPWVRRAAAVVLRLCRHRPDSALAPLAAFALGRSGQVEDLIRAAMTISLSQRAARRLAEVSLAAGHISLTDELLAGIDPDAGFAAGARARRAWFAGEMSTAISTLDGGTGADQRHRERLATELRVFTGWRPSTRARDVTSVPQRVLHVLTNSLPHTGSGYAQRTHSILNAQYDAGWDVLGVTRLGYPVQVGKVLARTRDVVGAVPYRRLLPGRLAAGADGRLQQHTDELMRITEEFGPAVLHSTTHFVNGLVTREVAEKSGIPWVYEVRGQMADTWAAVRPPAARQSERYRLFQERETEMMLSADLVVTLGEAMRATIIERGISAEKILVSPNAVGEQFLNEPFSPDQARGRVGLPVDGPIIGTVSSLVGYEGLDDLVDIFSLLAGRYPRLRLLIVGDGVAAPALRSRVQELGLQDRVIFTGRVPREQAHLYHQALDVFVVPRKDLPVTRSVTPLKPLEAAACSRPVVASNLPALAEVMQENVNGILCPASDTDAFAAAIGGFLDDERRRHQWGAAGRRWVLTERTWAANAEAYTRAYNRLSTVR